MHIYVYTTIISSSWGPADDGKTMVEPGIHAQKAFEKGVKEVQLF